MYQMIPTRPLGRRRSIAAERQAEVFRQHYAAPAVEVQAAKGECPTCRKVFKRLDKHRCKG